MRSYPLRTPPPSHCCRCPVADPQASFVSYWTTVCFGGEGVEKEKGGERGGEREKEEREKGEGRRGRREKREKRKNKGGICLC